MVVLVTVCTCGSVVGTGTVYGTETGIETVTGTVRVTVAAEERIGPLELREDAGISYAAMQKDWFDGRVVQGIVIEGFYSTRVSIDLWGFISGSKEIRTHLWKSCIDTPRLCSIPAHVHIPSLSLSSHQAQKRVVFSS